MATAKQHQNLKHVFALICGIVVVAVIVWIDVATGVWQEVTILSGLAAGLVTFLFSALVLGRIVDRNAARRWAPIHRLAISEFLHAIVDDDASEIALGKFVARRLELPAVLAAGASQGAPGSGSFDRPSMSSAAALDHLRAQVVFERRALSDALSRWTTFLASSEENESILQHIAGIALQLDVVRDATLEVDRHGAAAEPGLRAAVATCNEYSMQLINELSSRLVLAPECHDAV